MVTADRATTVAPRSVDEAVAAFRDGEPPAVVGGGTTVVPDVAAGRLWPRRTLLLWRAGLDTLSREAGRVRIGSAVRLDRLDGAPPPLPEVAGHVADREILGQATIGGNLCAVSPDTHPVGDLQAPLLALGARVTYATRTGEETRDVDDFLAGRGEPRLVLWIDVDDLQRLVGLARLDRPHTHGYTALHVCAAARSDAGRLTDVRVALGGATAAAVRLPAVEREVTNRAPADVDPAAAAARALEGLEPRSDSLASAWYRTRLIPVLVRRALEDLRGGEPR